MAQSLLFLGASLTNEDQLFQVVSPSGSEKEIDLVGYPIDGAAITDLTTFAGQLYFSGGTLTSTQLWSFSTLSGIATQVVSSPVVSGLQPANLTVLNNKLYFSGRDASDRLDLYSSDGTATGTASIKVEGVGLGGLVPDDIVAFGGRLYFSGLDATGVSRLWVSDGTAEGTTVLPVFNIDTTNINLGGAGLNPQNITVANGKLFFSGTDTNGRNGLWVSDGTSVGTSELAIAGAASHGINPTTSDMVAFNGRVYFAGTDASGATGLWSSDGTATGTTELAITGAGPNGVNPVSLTAFGGLLYFGGIDVAGMSGLWKSDGTPGGTSELSVAGASPGGLSPVALDASDHPNVAMSVFDGEFYFSGVTSAGVTGLWRSDGTAIGTVQVGATSVGNGLAPSDLAVVDLDVPTVGAAPSGANGSTIPAASLGTKPFATYAPLVVGSGPYSITLNVAEEAYQGDAQYTIAVDNVQIGGTLTSAANYAAGQSQTVTVEGSWTTGVHTLTIDFLNDAYGNSTETDRNLYVSLATPDDAVGGSSMFLGYQGSQQIYVQPEPTVTVSEGDSPPSTPPASTSPVSTSPVSTGSPPSGGSGSSGNLSDSPTVSGSIGSTVSGAGTPPVSTPPVALPTAPIATTSGSSGGTILLPVSGSAPTVPGSSGNATQPVGTAVLQGTDSVSAVLSNSGYIVSQTASSATYLTPKSAAALTTLASLSNVVYSQGTDTINAQGTTDLVFATGPSATVTGGTGTLIFVAGDGSYVAGGGSGTNILYGGIGTSVLTGASGPGNILVAGSGNITLSGGSGNGALMFGGSGMTTFTSSADGADTMVGGTGANVFNLTTGDIAFGGPGSPDLFVAGDGNTLVVEGSGNTQVDLGRGSLTAFAGSGADTYSVAKGLSGQATIVGFKAGDRINLTGGFTASDGAASLKTASTGSFGTALILSDGTRIVLPGVALQTSQLIVS